MINIWTQSSPYNLGTFQEGAVINQLLPVHNDTGVVYTVIAGKLPGNLHISANRLVGTISEVTRTTEFIFCIRGQLGNSISDRTMHMIVDGADSPIFTTPAGILSIGPAHENFLQEQTYVSFQLGITDSDVAAGESISLFIAANSGELPPGLSLSTSGLISGFVGSILSLKPSSVAVRGYDSYKYDGVFYDMSFAELMPPELNITYTFIVTAVAGALSATRKFSIFVVGDNYLRGDNIDVTASSGTLVDATPLRAPIWLVDGDLGSYTANNYLTILLTTYPTRGVVYTIDNINFLPPGLHFDNQTAGLYGVLPFQLALRKVYRFNITATIIDGYDEVAASTKQFTITIVNESVSIITWQTPVVLDMLYTNIISDASVVASSSLLNTTVQYAIVNKAGESLPPGLQLELDGAISGKVSLVSNASYNVTINAYDLYGSANRTFRINVNKDDTLLYSNIYVKPMMSLENRERWNNFINDDRIFAPANIYKMTDINYGVRTDLAMLIYAGIQRTTADDYVAVMNNNHNRKRFQFGNIVVKKVTDVITAQLLYEVICVEMIDNLEPNGKRLPLAITPNTSSTTYYPNSISNWRDRISNITTAGIELTTNNKLLPMWIQSEYNTQLQSVGFILAVPLCFCKPGTASEILLNIKHSGFDFKLFEYLVDRYTIDAVSGYTSDKYLEFKNERTTIG